MSDVELFVRHEAEIDALAYFEYIRHRDPDAALRFLAGIDSTVEALTKQPLMGRLRAIGDLAHQAWRYEFSSGSAKKLKLNLLAAD